MSIALSVLIALVAFSWTFRDFRVHGPRPRQFLIGWFGVYFGLIPPFIMNDRSVWNTRFYRVFTPESFIFAGWMSLVGLITMLAVFSVVGARPPSVLSAPTSESRGDERNTSRMRVLLWVGLGSITASIALNGGLSEVANNISEIRSTSGGSTTRVLAAGLMLGRHWILLAAIYFSLQGHFSDKARASRALAVLAWTTSILLALLSGGRATAINVLIAGLVTIIVVRGRLPVVRSAMVACAAFFMVLYGKTILFQLTSSEFSDKDASAIVARTQNEGQLSVFLREFTHPYLSFVQAIDVPFDYRQFGDYWYWAVKPFKLLGFSPPESISYFNTYLTWGSWDSEVPPGLLGFGYLSLGVLGVAIHCGVVAWILALLERMFYSDWSILGVSLGIQTTVIVPSIVSASDPALLFQNYFILGLPLFWLVRERARPRKMPHSSIRVRSHTPSR